MKTIPSENDAVCQTLIYLFKFSDGGQVIIFPVEGVWICSEKNQRGEDVELFEFPMKKNKTFDHLLRTIFAKYKPRLHGAGLQAIYPPTRQTPKISRYAVIFGLHVANIAAALICLILGVLGNLELFFVAAFFLILFFDAFFGKNES